MPPTPSRSAIQALAVGLSLVLVGLAFSACAPSLPAGEAAGLSTSQLSAHLGRLVGVSRDTLGVARRAAYAAERLHAAQVQPVLRDAFVVPHPLGREPAYVLGYIAGRNPRVSSRIVLLAADLQGPAAAGTLEAARLLGAEAPYTLIPERTVGVALWAAPSERGVQAFLARPPWALGAIERVLIVTADTLQSEPLRARWEAAGVPTEWVTPGVPVPSPEAGRASTAELALAYRLAEAAYLTARATAATSLSAPIDPDSDPLYRPLP